MLIWDKCLKYTQLRDSVNDLPEVQEVYKDNKQLFEELTNFTGMTIASASDINSLYGTLEAEVCATYYLKVNYCIEFVSLIVS